MRIFSLFTLCLSFILLSFQNLYSQSVPEDPPPPPPNVNPPSEPPDFEPTDPPEDAPESVPETDDEVINVSTRGFLNSGPGNEFNLGFQISGNVPVTVVIRITGEDTLRPVFDNALGGDSSSISLVQDPNMTLRRTDVSPPIVVAQQDNWEELSADLLDLLTGTAFDPVAGDNALGAAECLMPVTLEPGNYTVQVFGGGDDDNGVVLGEVNSIAE